MDLSTTYLGLRLKHPFMPGASPLVDDLDTVRRLEDAGASAIVMHSLFEEQIVREQVASFLHTERHGESFAEALCFFPSPEKFALGPEEYLKHLSRVKEAVGIPVIGSLNGTTLGGWLDYAAAMEQVGASALELNVYALPTNPDESGQEIEDRTIGMLRAVKRRIRIPVALKLSPFYSAPVHFARRLDQAAADGLVLFNRFYQPDIDVDDQETVSRLALSTSAELPLRLRWLAILSGRIKASLAVTGGVHQAVDAVKAVMAGAHAVQMVSSLLRNGPDHLARVCEDFATWMDEHEFESVDQMRGSLNLMSCPDPAVYERANYMLLLQQWREPAAR
jgi:dihydroorotate dehydrogenase (fumarate)